jgi:hypothetical protein
LQNVKTEWGTPYLSRTLSVKVADREQFLAFVRLGNWEFLDARCLKDPVKDLMMKNEEATAAGKTIVPLLSLGIATEVIVKCNIRKS